MVQSVERQMTGKIFAWPSVQSSSNLVFLRRGANSSSE